MNGDKQIIEISAAAGADFWVSASPVIGHWYGTCSDAGLSVSAEAAPFIRGERHEATAQERNRILALLEKIKPGEQPYTRRDWALEQRGEMRMWERMVKAIQE